MASAGQSVRAVVFDLGGVILESPIPAVSAFERDHGIDTTSLLPLLVDPEASFARLMRGEVTPDAFGPLFGEESEELGVGRVDGRMLLDRLEAEVTVRPVMLRAVVALRAAGYLTGVITNNWRKFGIPDSDLAGHFDVFVESWEVGMAKPDPAIYRLACSRLGIEPPDVVFLDDFIENIEAAAALGMSTVLVRDPIAALADLGEMIGIGLPG